MVSRRNRYVQALIAGSVAVLASMAQPAEKDRCGAAIEPKLKGSALSEKLAKCDGVLKPSGAADSDIIIPARKIDDWAVVHPNDLHHNKAVAK